MMEGLAELERPTKKGASRVVRPSLIRLVYDRLRPRAVAYVRCRSSIPSDLDLCEKVRNKTMSKNYVGELKMNENKKIEQKIHKTLHSEYTESKHNTLRTPNS